CRSQRQLIRYGCKRFAACPSAMFVLPMSIFGEPIRDPLGARVAPGRVYSRRPDLPSGTLGRITQPGTPITHLKTAGSQNRIATALRWSGLFEGVLSLPGKAALFCFAG